MLNQAVVTTKTPGGKNSKKSASGFFPEGGARPREAVRLHPPKKQDAIERRASARQTGQREPTTNCRSGGVATGPPCRLG